jgi:hypothetical protein
MVLMGMRRCITGRLIRTVRLLAPEVVDSPSEAELHPLGWLGPHQDVRPCGLPIELKSVAWANDGECFLIAPSFGGGVSESDL